MAELDTRAGRGITRGEGTTRLEAFVDAAFAFAVTLLVISSERMPDSVAGLLRALKNVPAFAASFAMLALFWYAHVRWSRDYRVTTASATLLSLTLVFLVLVFVYPLRLLLGTFFAWISGGWLPMPLSDVTGPLPLAWVYMFYGAGFALMSACIGGLYLVSWRRRRSSGLLAAAAAGAMAEAVMHLYFVLVALLSMAVAGLLHEGSSPWVTALPGVVYFLLCFSGLVQAWARRRARAHLTGSG